jgi:F-type H+-transporting ATPase subunit gamma
VQRLAEIRGHIKSVSGIRQVCRTMATVSSAKLSKARDQALGLRVYSGKLRGVVERQQAALGRAGSNPAELSPLLVASPEPKRIFVLALGGDRGLCGGYNIAISRTARAFAEERTEAGQEVAFAVLGGRVERYIRRLGAYEIENVWFWPRQGVTADLVDELYELVSAAFMGGGADEVWCAYTQFISPVQREPRVIRLLPIVAEARPSTESDVPGWVYEPQREPAVREAVERLARAQVEDVILESFASEHAARMVTMEEASERADKMLAELMVHANRVRREAVTADLLGVLVSKRVGKEAASNVAKR